MPNNYGTGPVPQNWSGQDRKFADSLKENVDVICGHRGDPLDRAVTARDLLDSGLATLPAGANFYSGSSDGLDPIPYLIPNLLIPPIVTNLTATGGFSVILLGWDMPLYLGHAFYEIWRNTSDSISSSTLLATTTQMTGLYSDYAGSAETYYYWVRAVNSNGIAGPFNSSIGTSATTQPDVALILDLLEGSITDSQLAVSLSSSITGVATNVAAAASDAAAATAAKTAALLAQAGAETAEDNAEIAETNAETAQSAASTSANAASNSATGAAGSASSASTSATNAASSENNAGSSATAASTSASNANTYATAAGTASTASQNASVTATTASNNAASSASSAGSAATSAANFASNASASQSAAGTSATSANTSATNAYTSASNASTYSNTATSAATAASGHASAASSTVNGLTARLNNTGGTGVTVEQAYSANASDIGDLEGQYSVKIDANGHVAGFGLSNTLTTAGPSSAFIVRADKFAVIDPASAADGLGTTSPTAANIPFFIQGGTTYIKAAAILDASITDAKIGTLGADKITSGFISSDRIDSGSINVNKLELVGTGATINLKSANTGARMVIQGSKIQVFDSTGAQRVRLGNLTS
tara:strand:+ start:2161 stop:3957 length:1797 start_codon:yes stop_codon:yes gene_type:complete